mgnify:FL=1
MKFFYYLKLAYQKKTKFKLFPPKKSELIIFDHGEDQLNFLKFNKYSIYFNRGEEINLFILLSTIFKDGFSNLIDNYRLNYLKFVKAKFIITYRCDNKNFYELKKKINGVRTILIQWGKTTKEYLRHFITNKSNFSIDEMYLLGDETARIFSENIKGKSFGIGSIANNRIDLKQNKVVKNSLIFVSQAKGHRIFPEIEKKIIKFLKSYCLKNNLKLCISTRVLSTDIKGKKYYSDILGDSGWEYFPRNRLDSAGDYEHYLKVLLSEYVVCIDSTLGYEALSRKKKVVFFPLGSFSPEWCKKNYIVNLEKNIFWIPTRFGYPLDLDREGSFWLSDYDERKMEKKLNFLRDTNQVDWETCLKNLGLEKIIRFDFKNKTLINNLNKMGLPLKEDDLIR